MNAPQSDNKFQPRQALTPTADLFDELVGDTLKHLADASIAQISTTLTTGSTVHDVGCGTGSGSAAVMALASKIGVDVSIKGTDINERALEIYKSHLVAENWPAEAIQMDCQKLTFDDNFFSHAIGNAFLFALPGDGIEGVKEIYRTLKPGGTMVTNSWHYTPNVSNIQTASRLTRPEGSPQPRLGMQKWEAPEFLRDVLEKGGFEREKITLTKAEVIHEASDITRFATMSWSFIGGTSTVGWLKSDEDTWDKAVEIVKDELSKSKGFKDLGGGRFQIKFVANIAVATK